MKIKTEIARHTSPLYILLMGNNPIDMSKMIEKLNSIHGTQIVTEIAFDLKSLVNRLVTFNPNFILIDDNIGKSVLAKAVDTLTQNSKTKNIPITVLKNSNYQESYGASAVLDYILKTNFSTDSLYKSLRNCLKFRRTQSYFKQPHINTTKLLVPLSA
jgi:DNA-binding NarL/FixJ family response regulator